MEPSCRLITIPISHFCERARWALERAHIRYSEEQHLQILHWPHAHRAARSRTVPILITADGKTLADSHDIVAFADERGARLYPKQPEARAEIEAFEQRITSGLGVEGRRLMYAHLLAWGRAALPFNGGSAPRWEKRILDVGYGVARGMLRRHVGVNPKSVARAKLLVDEALDEVGARLEDGRPFLFGDRFSAADLTFSCMAAAVVLPPGYGVELPPLEILPATTRDLISTFRAHPAGAFTMRMFGEHRSEHPTETSPPHRISGD